MKTIKKIIILSLFVLLFTQQKTNATAQKKIETNLNIVRLKAGEEVTIKTNCKNFKITSFYDHIFKTKINGNKIKIKAYKNGFGYFKIKKDNYKTKEITVRITKFKTEKEYLNSIKGISKKYKNILKYPYFKVKNKKFYKEKSFRELIQLAWEAMPEYLKDNLIKNHYEINIQKDNFFKGTTLGNADDKKIYLKISDHVFTTLVHESAHAYHFSLYKNVGISILDLKEICKEYNKNPKKYGLYGSTNIDEFYAEKISAETVKNGGIISNNKIFNYIWNYCDKNFKSGSYQIACNVAYVFSECIDNVKYINGQKADIFYEKLIDFLKQKIKEKYSDANYSNITITLR